MMKFSTLLKNKQLWQSKKTPKQGIIVSSRVRLARNLNGSPFPGWAKVEDRNHVLQSIMTEAKNLPEFEDCFAHNLENLNKIQKQALVERRLISREHAAKSAGSAVLINRPQNIAIMINEEDHLRMQAIAPGLNLEQALEDINKIDDRLEKKLPFAYDEKLGYLTACPTNLGTGMRASVMLHLPALCLNNDIKKVIEAVNKIDLAVRGIYGEGTDAMANLFQISNQYTLGDREENIVKHLKSVVGKIIDHEKTARDSLLKNKLELLQDNIGRAYGILRYANFIVSQEALNHLSMIKLGADMGFFPKKYTIVIEELLNEIQPAHIQLKHKKSLESSKRDMLRAKVIREQLTDLPPPSPPK